MKTIIWIIVIILIVLGAYWLLKSPSTNIEPASTNVANQDTGAMMEDGTLPSTSISTSSTAAASTAKTVTVTYTNTGFSPSSVNINVGDTVKFVNQRDSKMWVASAAHPTHKVYDGTDLQTHCATGATPSFDECKGEPNGASYSFTFTKAGTWNYHDHLAPSFYGSVVVK